MKWLVTAIGLAAAGCTSQSVATGSSGSATSNGASSTGTTSGGGTSSGGTSSGGATSSGATTGTAPVCNPACGANAVCEAGGCQCIAGTKNCLLRDGGLNCVDLNTDKTNCFSCGTVCPDQATCRAGVCDCDAGPACLTNDNGFECFAFGSDPLNCGSCGNVCSVAGQSCIDGGCECPGNQVICDLACLDVASDSRNCGSCGNVCAVSYASGSGCRKGVCSCDLLSRLCAKVPAGAPPTCDCSGTLCSSPSFAQDIYPLLAQQNGAFGCAASGCHGGANPAAGLGFLDESGNMDAGMAYAELLGLDGGGEGTGVPTCDAGLPSGAPSTQCACVSRVVPGDVPDSYLIDVLTNALPASCAMDLPMPIDADGGWIPLDACSQQLIEQWIELGAAQ